MASEVQILSVLHWLDTHIRSQLQEHQISLYLLVLQDIPFADLAHAAFLHPSENRFFPHPSELRAAALKIHQARHCIPDEFEAWREVNAEIKRVGYIGQPRFSHELINEAVESLGWRHLCLSSDHMSDRSQFLNAYRTRRERAIQHNSLPEPIRQHIAGERSSFAIQPLDEQAQLPEQAAHSGERSDVAF